MIQTNDQRNVRFFYPTNTNLKKYFSNRFSLAYAEKNPAFTELKNIENKTYRNYN